MKTTNLNLLMAIAVLLTAQLDVISQTAGDYRSKTSGDWNDLNIWEVYNGTNWVDSDSKPNNSSSVTVTIRSGNTVYLSYAAEILNLEVESGAKFYRNSTSVGRTLKVHGNITCDGIIGNGATLDRLSINLLGTSTTISGSGECKFYSMKKNSTHPQCNLTFDMDIELYATSGTALYNNSSNSVLNILINPGIYLITHTKLDLDYGTSNKLSTLHLKSDETGSGSLITTSVLDSDESNTIVERYLNEDCWHYISSPVNNPSTGVFLDIYLMTFNEMTGSWKYIVNEDSALYTNMQGFSVWTSNELIGNTTVQYTGVLNSGYQSIALTHTAGAVHNSKGFNFVGNPFSSAVDWDYSGYWGWTKTNVDDAIYFWNSETSNYDAYVNGVGTNGATSHIPVHQGFFVHCNAATGLLGVNYGAQVHSEVEFYKNGEETSPKTLSLIASGNSGQDETVIRLSEKATNEYDGHYDAYKMMGSLDLPQIYSLVKEDKLAINTLHSALAQSLIRLGFRTGESGIYTLSWDGLTSFEEGTMIYLEDLKTGTYMSLSEANEYSFNYETGDTEHRFNLMIEKGITTKINKVELNTANVYSFGQTIFVQPFESGDHTVSIYNLLGQEIVNKKINGTKEEFEIKESGYYFVRIIGNNGMESTKVFIK